MYLQTRKYSNAKVREIVTRDMTDSTSWATDTKLEFPRLVDTRSVWEPNDSKHGGKLYLNIEIGGAPDYEEFLRDDSTWVSKLNNIRGELEHAFTSCHIFTERRQREWRVFFERYPWGGLVDVEEDHRPPFVIPEFPAGTDGGRGQVGDLMMTAGEDEQGRPRLYFERGMDLLSYPRAPSRASFGKFLLDGSSRPKRHLTDGESKGPCFLSGGRARGENVGFLLVKEVVCSGGIHRYPVLFRTICNHLE